MVSCEAMRNAPACGGDRAVVIYCKLFSDMVTDRLCALRKEELDAKGGFSCGGCVMKKNMEVRAPACLAENRPMK